MRFFNRLGVVVLICSIVIGGAGLLEARTKKGDKFFKQGRQAQLREEWDEALKFFELALDEDPGDAAYRMSARRVRFQAGQAHVKHGQDLRKKGKLEEALKQFQSAYAIDPSSTIAAQELRLTYRLIK